MARATRGPRGARRSAVMAVPTAAIALASLGLLWRFKVPEPLLVLIAGLAGLVLSPLVR